MRIMALDVGERRIGVAMSDPLGITAQPWETYVRVSRQADVAYFVRLIQTQDVREVVCGLPFNMDGTEGFQAESTRAFAGALEEACKIPVQFVDERLTTQIARATLIQSGMRREKRKQVIDKLAAVQILQTYMNAKG